MKTLAKRIVALSAITLVATTPAHAIKKVFDASQNCREMLNVVEPADQIMVGMWAFGYLASAKGRYKIVDQQLNNTMLKVLNRICDKNPRAQFRTVVKKMAAETRAYTKEEIAGRKLLDRFFDRNPDYVALTRALKPTPEDIQSVYAEPLASNLIVLYERLFKPGVAIRPKAGQNTVLSQFTTTKRLKSDPTTIRQFPGGYKKVTRFIRKNVPIARFKFVRSGEKLGLAFDGLIYVNGRWVLMPKPWRGLQ